MKKITSLIILFLCSSAFAFNFASPSDASAKVVMNNSSNAKQIFPVRLLMVNGENVSVRSDAFWLEPGEYELRLAALINLDYTKQVMTPQQRRGLDKDMNNTLKIKVEADKSYYIGFDASSTEVKDWHPVVYNIK